MDNAIYLVNISTHLYGLILLYHRAKQLLELLHADLIEPRLWLVKGHTR